MREKNKPKWNEMEFTVNCNNNTHAHEHRGQISSKSPKKIRRENEDRKGWSFANEFLCECVLKIGNALGSFMLCRFADCHKNFANNKCWVGTCNESHWSYDSLCCFKQTECHHQFDGGWKEVLKRVETPNTIAIPLHNEIIVWWHVDVICAWPIPFIARVNA